MSILSCEQPIGRKTYSSGLLHLQKLTVLKFISTTCYGRNCVLTPSPVVHLSKDEKGGKSGHFVRLQASKQKSKLILAGECLGRETDFGGLLLLVSSADSKQLPTTVRPLVLLFITPFLWRHPQNNPETICEIQANLNL